MKIAIIFESKTGNTALVAEAIKDVVNDNDLVYFGAPVYNIIADVYFVGSWTDKGMCSTLMSEFLGEIKDRKVAYFGTCGFGGDATYYDRIYSRVQDIIDESNDIYPTPYVCQGKMPLSVRDRYVSMLHEHPDDKRLKVSIDNFDEALNHPNDEDIANAKKWAREVLDAFNK